MNRRSAFRKIHGLLLPALLVLAMALPAAAEEPQVPDDYKAIAAETQAAGRAVMDLFIVGDAKGIFDRFNSEMRAAVSLIALRNALLEILGTDDLGDRLLEGIRPLTPTLREYRAAHRWGDSSLAFIVVFNPDGRIAGLSFDNNTDPPDPAADRATSNKLRLPFDGDWWTVWGGSQRLLNYHVVAPDQRHAYDFVVWKDGATFSGDGTTNEQYWAWGRPVLSPGDGTVVEVVDGVKDNLPQRETQNAANPAGNHVVIDLGNGEFALIAHFQRRSIEVQVGDKVTAGQQLGLCGNSGNSSEPHVHIHLQDRAELFRGAVGLPLQFQHALVDGERPERAEPVLGQFVRNLEN